MGLTLRQYREMYEGILRDPSRNRRVLQLENLMTAMEIAYDIPLLKETGWVEEQVPVMDLYKEVGVSLKREREAILGVDDKL